MTDKDKSSRVRGVGKSTRQPKGLASGRRKTRLLALETRVLFDGALAVDVSAKVAAAGAGDAGADAADTSHAAATAFGSTAAQPAARTTDVADSAPIEKSPADATTKPTETAKPSDAKASAVDAKDQNSVFRKKS